ncbi:DUF3231 family protein [Virgibacillus necropolis]|uniref:Uncharacterized protein n=1 Tax=Virgibacillus necropolis TaxID=163877 RepID=A0A221MH96_9BACI|nr:DUF3231 family protein [Virgibacillus necropolis]ASN07027.1 hypothetical protein CFK40_19410 [Virgibacillus necropolis]
MENNEHNHIELTSSEISSLWGSYQADTMLICGIKYFLVNIKDMQIKSTLEYALSLIEGHKNGITQILNEEEYPVPQGFTEDDVNLNTPRLFTDKLYLEFLLNMSGFVLAAYSLALSLAERNDVIDYYAKVLSETQVLHKKTKQVAKEKGTYIRSPLIPKPSQIDFVHNQSFLSGWFGEKRPLLGVEISNLVFNARRNALGQAIITGFSQVAQSKEVRHYFERGRDISGKHVNVFTKILNESYLSSGALLATPEVTNSKEAPFSDKLMMFLITTLIASGIGQYGLAMAASPRHDLGVKYSRLIAEIAKYSNDGAKILINNGWMELPPIAADRKDLAK